MELLCTVGARWPMEGELMLVDKYNWDTHDPTNVFRASMDDMNPIIPADIDVCLFIVLVDALSFATVMTCLPLSR